MRSHLKSFAESEILSHSASSPSSAVAGRVAALKAESIASHRHLSPWAATGYVLPSHRGHGIGAQRLSWLLLLAEAGDLGFSHVYCGTSTSSLVASFAPVGRSLKSSSMKASRSPSSTRRPNPLDCNGLPHVIESTFAPFRELWRLASKEFSSVS